MCLFARVADSAAINGHRRSGERNAIPPYKDFSAAINGHRRSGQKRSIPPYKDFTAAFNNQRRSGDVGRNPPQPALVSFYKGCGLRRNECMVCRAESASFADSAAINGHRRSGQKRSIPPYKDFTAAFNNQRRSGDVGRNPPQPALVSFYKGCGLRRNECMVCRAESASFADSAAINGHRRRGERNAIPPYKDFTAAFNIQRRSGQKRSIPPYKDFTARSELLPVDPILLLKYFWVNNRHIFI